MAKTNVGNNSTPRTKRSRVSAKLRNSSSGDLSGTGETPGADGESTGASNGSSELIGISDTDERIEREPDSLAGDSLDDDRDSASGSGSRELSGGGTGVNGGGDRDRSRTVNNGQSKPESERNAKEHKTDSKRIVVDFDKLFDDEPQPQKRKRGPNKSSTRNVTASTLADGFKLVYAAPTLLGTGDKRLKKAFEHWPLEDDEANQLATDFLRAAGTVDNKNFQKLLKTLEKFAPWGALAMTAWIITADRVKTSNRILSEMKKESNANSPSSGPERDVSEPDTTGYRPDTRPSGTSETFS